MLLLLWLEVKRRGWWVMEVILRMCRGRHRGGQWHFHRSSDIIRPLAFGWGAAWNRLRQH